MVSFIYPCLTWWPGLLHWTVVLIHMDNVRMLVAASNKQKRSSCQNSTHSTRECLGHTEEQLEAGWRWRRVKEFWDAKSTPHPSTHPLYFLRPPLSPLPPPLFSLPHSGNPQRYKLKIRSLISSLDVALGCPGLIIPLITLPFYSPTQIQSPSCSLTGFVFFAFSFSSRTSGPWRTIRGAMM